jgi:hypothetical protein
MANFVNPNFDTNLLSWAAGILPSDIANLSCWFKAESLSLNDTDPVASWADSSSNGNDIAQSTAGLKPTFHTNEVLSLPAVAFDGGDWLSKSSPSGLPSGNANCHTFCILNPISTSAPNTSHSFGDDTATGGSNYFIFRSGASLKYELYGTAPQTVVGTMSAGTWYLAEGKYNSAAGKIYAAMNGSAYNENTVTANFGTAHVEVGALHQDSIFWNGYIAEIFEYAANITGTNLSGLFAYLAKRYGVTIAGADGVVTRDTGTKYAGAASSKIVATNATNYYEVINPGTTGDYTLSGYVYTAGGAVTSSDLELFYDTTTVSTAFADQGGGWYKMTATVTGANANKKCGIQVKAGKTVYVDSFDLTKSATGQFLSPNSKYW